MSRKIYLPELLSITVKNYTLYPNGLDYTYNFVKGVNLILGGNGMGKTTFVNIIKYAIIGPYRQQFDYSRTYKDQKIEKRLLNKADYFVKRMDPTIEVEGHPIVSLHYKLHEHDICVTRTLDEGTLIEFALDGVVMSGEQISQTRYEMLSIEDKKRTLPFVYEQEVERLSELSFDDLIFFVNEILYFGEDHKTILWRCNQTKDVQTELFNKFFNDKKLDEERQEAERQAKYYDSRSRHCSEDMRAITKALEKVVSPRIGVDAPGQEVPVAQRLFNLRNEIDKLSAQIDGVQEDRKTIEFDLTTMHKEQNDLSMSVSLVDQTKARIESQFNASKWEKMNPRYSIYLRHIQLNHACPMCNQTSETLYKKLTLDPSRCVFCGQKLKEDADEELRKQYDDVMTNYKEIYQRVNSLTSRIHQKEQELKSLDVRFRQLDTRKRELQQQVRDLEYIDSQSNAQTDIQAIYDELERLRKAKDEFQQKSIEERQKALRISQTIEGAIIEITKRFSDIFAEYAELFLGLPCRLTYEKIGGSEERRFYPVINGQPRWNEEELSESQRFFVDHSFRMSILTFFYAGPAFYIVETPDSSLDISYENNAAKVFKHFLRNPNTLILTSNLNNSSFVQSIIDNRADVPVAMVGLLDIAKQSIIQNTSEKLKEIYQSIKNQLR